MKNNANVLIIGVSGQVGQGLLRRYHEVGVRPWTTSRKFTDDLDKRQLQAELGDSDSINRLFRMVHEQSNEPFTVYLCAAFTWVDGCENDPERSERDNLRAPEQIADLCREYGDKLIFYSSEYVFGQAEYAGGAVGPFSEEDPAAPTSVYGRHKAQAEAAIQQRLPDALIIRTTTVFSYDPEGLNFAMQVYRFLRDGFADGFTKKFRVPNDQVSSPTYAPALAEASIHLVESGANGVFNLVGSDTLARSAFTEKLIEAYGFDRDASLAQFEFLATSELGQSARRPLTAGLRTDKASAAGCKICALADALADLTGQMR